MNIVPTYALDESTQLQGMNKHIVFRTVDAEIHWEANSSPASQIYYWSDDQCTRPQTAEFRCDEF